MTAAGAPTISVIVRSMDRPMLARALASIAAQDASRHRGVDRTLRCASCRGRWTAGRGMHARSLAVDAEEKTLYVYGGPWVAWRQLSHGFFQLGAVMLRRELVARGVRFDESLEILDDLEFFVQCAQLTTFRYIAKPVSRYHVTEGTSGTGEGGNRDAPRLQRALANIRHKWRNLARVLEESAPARLDRARALLDRALALLPGNPGLLENVALLERRRRSESP
jgi:hypothetical protein